MAGVRTLNKFVEANLDLLTDDPNTNAFQLSEKLSQEEREEVEAIFDSQEIAIPENESDLSDFETEKKNKSPCRSQ